MTDRGEEVKEGEESPNDDFTCSCKLLLTLSFPHCNGELMQSPLLCMMLVLANHKTGGSCVYRAPVVQARTRLEAVSISPTPCCFSPRLDCLLLHLLCLT